MSFRHRSPASPTCPPWVVGLFAALLVGGGCASAPVIPARADAASDRSVRPLPASRRLRVVGHAQRRSLSCESRSAVDLLAFHGIAVTEADFVSSLPRADNPHLGFVGDIDGPGEQLPPRGYGVYAQPIAALLSARGLPATARRDVSLDVLRSEIAAGRPVIVWGTGGLAVSPPVELRDRAGNPFRAVRGEHTFLAVGYGPGVFWLVDPATGKTKRVFERTFDASYRLLGRMAVTTQEGARNTSTTFD